MKNQNRTIKLLVIDNTNNIHFRFSGSSRLVHAKYLDLSYDSDGNICNVLLDRCIHKPDEDVFDCNIDGKRQAPFNISGPFVTELTRR